MSIKNVIVSSVALLGLGFAPAIGSIASAATTVAQADTVETTTVNRNGLQRRVNMPGVVKVWSGSLTKGYDKNGNVLADGPWYQGSYKTDFAVFAQGHLFFRVSTDAYLKDDDVQFTPSV
ncbi:hypothetical protein [Companilactobacillus ginsenosidimutans]|uniref:Surface layer protein A domain-containing protein n=1 Tax=Companilactobacillus ginsenosidimutans TaxID=1007676 RepID=A0A0H4QGR8_9LACO|nr:hypothetical protein [Companilactobacillus ginsenosidimutans]AKP67604.1 hypothetical protein ABM34_08715 [Companilactobacillus ginsenosidimutans]